MDFSELYHGWSISLCGVLDLQPEDVNSRHQLREDKEDQFSRSLPYLHRRENFGQPGSYSAVHNLCGLEQCIKDHWIVADKL